MSAWDDAKSAEIMRLRALVAALEQTLLNKDETIADMATKLLDAHDDIASLRNELGTARDQAAW